MRSSDQAPRTVRDVLLQSLDPHAPKGRGRGYSTRAVPIAAPAFDRYILRSDRLHAPAPYNSLRNELLQGSCLTVPEVFFVGPDVGQTLLIAPGKQMEGKKLSILPFHPGVTLRRYLQGGCEPEQKRLALMRHWTAHPELLDTLFSHAAFVGLQPQAFPIPDRHADNIMVNDACVPSLIDIVSPEDIGLFARKAKTMQERKDRAKDYVIDLANNLHMNLSLDDSILPPPGAIASEERFQQVLGAARKRSIARIMNGSLQASNPAWQGFRYVAGTSPLQLHDIPDDHHTLCQFKTLHGTSVVALDDPPSALKEKLDMLYGAAVGR